MTNINNENNNDKMLENNISNLIGRYLPAYVDAKLQARVADSLQSAADRRRAAAEKSAHPRLAWRWVIYGASAAAMLVVGAIVFTSQQKNDNANVMVNGDQKTIEATTTEFNGPLSGSGKSETIPPPDQAGFVGPRFDFGARQILSGGGVAAGGGGKSGYFYWREDAKLSDLTFGGQYAIDDKYQLGLYELHDSEFNTESYDSVVENEFLAVGQNPLSTFSIDVDTASYANIRRFISSGQLPPKGAVRIEEMINYFKYDYPPPPADSTTPFSVNTELAACPWTPTHKIVRIGLRGKDVDLSKRPASNLVFLLDVSGSMSEENKLPWVRQSMKMLLEQLKDTDRVAIAVYAGASGLVLDSTVVDAAGRQKILDAIDSLTPGGSTNGAEGIQLAYQIAAANFIKGGTNRVLLCTDGDFNVGVTDQGSLVSLIEEKAKGGVFLSILGFGMGNYKDSTVEKLADKGNGNYAYIDTLAEARRVLVQNMSGTLMTIAKDVKIQVEFNPARVAGYRLIGYENRILAKEDFNNDKKDAGEIGAGHTVTALYELVPAGGQVPAASVDPLKYQVPATNTAAAASNELLTVKLRYKAPDGDKSTLVESPVTDRDVKMDSASADFQFAVAVAEFGMSLRDSKYIGNSTMASAAERAQAAVGKDADGSRSEFISLVKKAIALKAAQKPAASNPSGGENVER